MLISIHFLIPSLIKIAHLNIKNVILIRQKKFVVDVWNDFPKSL